MTKRRTYENLGQFIAALDAAGELVRVKERVSPILEITELADRMGKLPGGGKALLFENVEGSAMPLLINAYGSHRRMAMALGVSDPKEIADQIEGLLHMAPPESMADKVAMLGTLFELAKFPPRKIRGAAPCHEVVHTGDAVDLSLLPALHCWPDDAGRFITFPLVFTQSLDGRRNLGMYRMQLFDKKTTGMHWHIHKDGAHNFHDYKRAGKRMEVAVAIGADPVVTYAATAPMPRGIDELLLAGLIRKKPVTLAKCKTVDMWVPAEAEIIIEGYVDPAEDFRLEGPFGDHTGYYSLADYYPAFHVTAITHRRNPVYFTTIVGKPPMEDCYMGRATSDIFLPMLRTVTPEIKDLDLPWEGVFHNCVIVSMEKRFPAAAHRLMNALWGAGQMSFAKMILAVDEGVDVHDYRAVFRLLMDNLDIGEDLFYSEGVLDVLDHSSPVPMRGGKLGIDATPRLKGEPPRRPPGLKPVDEAAIAAAVKAAGGLAYCIPAKETGNRALIVSIDKTVPRQAESAAAKLLTGAAGAMVNIVAVVDKEIDPKDLSTVTWKVFNNTDPRRDFIRREGALIVDATKKTPEEGHTREWPDDLSMSPAIKEKVEPLWLKIKPA